jgi:hypothetical protein
MPEDSEPPDIALGPLSIWIAGPSSDSEWLQATIAVETTSGSTRVNGDGLSCFSLAFFVRQLDAVYSTLLPPPAVLDASDMGVVLTVSPRSLGHMLVTLEIEGGAEKHRFEIACDQTDIAKCLSQSRRTAARCPSTLSGSHPKLSLPRPTGTTPDVTDLAGLELTIARLAADMRVFGFGPVVPHPNGRGTIATYALHVQCAWRITQDDRIVTGDGDLYNYVGPGQEPDGWEPSQGGSIQTAQLDAMLGLRHGAEMAFHYSSGIVVNWAYADRRRGDITIKLSSGHMLSVFPNQQQGEHWRLFKPGSDQEHRVFET